ncbi:MAG TPA: glycosyltransferase family 39 protein [Thermoleophilaceae bacterium]
MTGAARVPVTARSRAVPDIAPRWLFPALLALPFLIGIAVLKGLTVEIDTFHGSDARVYQLPTILQFSDRLDFSNYPSAQTPLYHLLTAGWGEIVGFDLWKLRLLNVAFSYGAALALLRLLRRATPLEPWQAFALTLLFTLSPYFFGASFTLLTDNLAILFALLALERVDRFRSDASLATFGVACLCIAGAVLTRQSFLWLVPLAAWFLLRSAAPAGRRVAGAALLALALAPLAALVVDWGGLVPPTADPASCGLCTDRPGVGRDALTLRTVGFTAALLGAYAAFIFGPGLLRRDRLLKAVPRGPIAVAVAAGLLLLAISPLAYEPIVPGQAGDAGYLWKISDRLPVVLGSSLVFWLLVPLGCLAVILLVRRAGPESLPAVYLAAFLIAALPVRLVYQKYFDPFALLAIALLARPPDLRGRWDYAGIALLCAGFVAYAISFAG